MHVYIICLPPNSPAIQHPHPNPSAPALLLGAQAGQPLEPRDLLERGDALARRQRQVAAGAVGLAEPALDAAVNLGAPGRKRSGAGRAE